MTNTIITERGSFNFLMGYLKMLGGSPDMYGDFSSKGLSVSVHQPEPEYCVACPSCGDDVELVVLKFTKEFEGRLVSFLEHTCTGCAERQYSV